MTTPLPPHPEGHIHMCLGAALPPLLHHHPHPRSHALTRAWQPTTNDEVINKPCGGLWAAPVPPPPGTWRPIPRHSAWREFCEAIDQPDRVRWQTRLYPDPHAVFLVIDSAADARALHDAFPHLDHPLEFVLGRPMIDWTAVDGPFAGVWLTEAGQRTTRRPPVESGTPSLDGWDVPTVWFSRPAYRIGATRPAPQAAPAHDMVSDAALRAALAGVKTELARQGLAAQ